MNRSLLEKLQSTDSLHVAYVNDIILDALSMCLR